MPQKSGLRDLFIHILVAKKLYFWVKIKKINFADYSLAEAEEKIAQLLKVKERYAVEREANSRLETSVVELEKEVSRLGSYSQTATAVAAVPIAILFLYFLSYFMSIFGGSSDKV